MGFLLLSLLVSAISANLRCVLNVCESVLHAASSLFGVDKVQGFAIIDVVDVTAFGLAHL